MNQVLNNAVYNSIITGKNNTIPEGSNLDQAIIAGQNNIVISAKYSIICGDGNNVRAWRSLVCGKGNITPNSANDMLVGGQFAKITSSSRLVIGNGTDKDNLSNAFEVKKDGSIVINGTTFTADTLKNKADKSYVDNAIKETEAKIAGVYKYKGSVNNLTELNDIENPSIGDVYNVGWDEYNEGNNYAWTGTEWEALGSTIDLNYYADKNFVANYVSDQGYATEDWVNENYLHYSEYMPIVSDSAAMAEEKLEPRFAALEEANVALNQRISLLEGEIESLKQQIENLTK